MNYGLFGTVLKHILFLRLCAYMFDYAVLMMFFFVSVILSGSNTFFVTISQLAAQVFYFTYFTSSPPGATPGQRMFRIQVLKNGGKILTKDEALDRTLMELFLPFMQVIFTHIASLIHSMSSPIYYVLQFVIIFLNFSSYSIALTSKGNKTIYDTLCDCTVVKMKKHIV